MTEENTERNKYVQREERSGRRGCRRRSISNHMRQNPLQEANNISDIEDISAVLINLEVSFPH